MQKILKNKTKQAVPRVDRSKPLVYCCGLCDFRCLFPSDLDYHLYGFHNLRKDFTNLSE